MKGRRERVLELLWAHDVVCSLADLYANALANGRNDVAAIAKSPGWRIRSQWTRHGEGPAHVDYVVERRPSPQLHLAIA